MSTATNTSLTDPVSSKRALLAERLSGAGECIAPTPLSFGQQRLWFLEQLEAHSALYNVPTLVRLTGRVDVDALQRALNEVVARHEPLRTRFGCVNETPMQFIQPRAAIKLEVHDLTAHSEETRESEARKLARAEFNRPFDLRTAPLLRAHLLRLNAEQHWLALTLHHIVCDEWSLHVLFKELTALYGALVEQRPVGLPELPIQYADYGAWQRGWLAGERLQELLAYWRKQLADNPPVTELPVDQPRTAVPTFNGSEVACWLSEGLSQRLLHLANEQQTTVFVVLLSAFSILLHRYTDETDLVIGSPIAGRTRAETEDLIGFFVNTLLLRTKLEGNPRFMELLAQVRQTTLDAFAQQDLPFEKLVEHLRPERSLSHLPCTKVMFVLQNHPLQRLKWPGVELEFLEARTDTSKFELTLVAQETRRGLCLRAEYNTRLFTASTISRLLRNFEVLLEGIVARPHARIGELPVLSIAEREQVLQEWNRTSSVYPRDRCIHELFEAQAASRPRSVAVRYEGRALTYGELNARANQLGHYLKRVGVGPGVLVGLALERSEELVIAMLSVLKAGAAYVPLDPSYPAERLQFMLADAAAPVVLTQQSLVGQLPRGAARVVCVDTDWELVAGESRQNVAGGATAEDMAYVMYTSGSTGTPKGAAVPHRGVTRLVLNTNYIQLDESDRVAQISNTSFDAATFEIWGALLNGGRLIGINKDVLLTPKLLGQALQEHKITAMFLTAALFNQLAVEAPGSFAGVRTVIAGGEPLDPKWVKAVLQDRPPKRLLNGYGPTENTTFTCWHLVREVAPDAVSVPIGRPIANTQVYILDRYLNPVPIGVPGELYAGGDGLALGYWNRPELTAERFIPNPFVPGQKLYRTGDLARYLEDGTIEFLGRRDQQVKVRGFRIELGELEAVLSRHPGVKQCVAKLDGRSATQRRLLAYFVPAGPVVANTTELRAFLAEKLPDFMLPAAFIAMEKLPLNANGKVERKALPQPEQARPELEKKYKPARTAAERQLVRIWEKVLGVQPIGVEDKFFELGGHSLLAVRLSSQVEKEFGKKLGVAAVFQAQTISQMAALLREDPAATPASSLVEIQPNGSRPPLFLVHGAGGGMFWGYVNLARALGPEHPIYGFGCGEIAPGEKFASVEDLAAKYLGDLRRVQPRGPYYLGGYCFGGVVAYEMARQLAQQQEQVGLLALFNCSPPNSSYTRIPWTPIWWLRLLRNLCYWATYVWSWNRTQRREFFRWKWTLLKKRLKAAGPVVERDSAAVEAGDLVDLSSFTEEQRRVWEAHIQALVTYHPRPYAGRVHLFRSPGHPLWCSFDPDYGWRELAKGGVSVTVVSGDHEKILEEPCVGELAGKLSEALGRAEPFDSPASLGLQAGPLRPVSVQTERAAPKEPNGASDGPGRPVALLSSAVSGARCSYPGPRSYVGHFVDQVLRTPSAIASRSAGQDLTYGELNSRANQLAHYLQSLGVGPEVLVAVCLERSLELMVALLAVLKSGGAYLPLDPTYPRARLGYMLADSKAQVLLTRAKLSESVNPGQAQVVCLDSNSVQRAVEESPSTEPNMEVKGEHLAYVIYTSGSTGTPKGVEVTQSALLNHNLAMAQAYQLQATDRVLQFTPLSFDISVEEIFPTWLSGGTLILRNEASISTPEQFLDFITQEQLTVLNLPTAYWHELSDYLDGAARQLPNSVRLVIIGGEKASPAALAKWRRAVHSTTALVNAYGATEATVTSTLYRARGNEEELPIGRPVANTLVLLLDERQQPVGPGQLGELHIGGAGLARGYRHRPELTEQRFIRNPFAGPLACPRLYKTGDLARLREDGELEFLGRLDEQVKLRGYRIELGEIEAVLCSHPGIKESVAIIREDVPGRKRLVAYYTARGTRPPGFQDVLRFLKQKLPAYMVPSVLMPIPSLPLTPAGKVDRRGLPAPGNARPEMGRDFAPPQTPLQERMAALWSSVLGVEPIGVNDNFFDLGGHSLAATQILSRIRDTLQRDLSLAEFFARPTVAELALYLNQAKPWLPMTVSRAELAGASRLPLSLRQQRLWAAEQFYKTCSPYNRPAGLRLRGALDLKALRQSLGVLVRRHAGLQAVFPPASEEPAQYLCEPKEQSLPVLDYSIVPEELRRGEAMTRLEQEARRPYIGWSPALRPLLVRLNSEEHWLLLITHELVCDRRSIGLLLRELGALYSAQVEQKPAALETPSISYAELIAAESRLSPTQEEHCRYWERQLTGVPELLELPADRPRPAERSGEGARIPVRVPKALLEQLKELSEREGCNVFVTLLAGFAALLHRYTASVDLVIGSVTSGSREMGESLVANLENPIALRCDLTGQPTFRALLERLGRIHSEALANSDVPFAEVIHRLNPHRNASYARLFQTALVLEEQPLLEQTAAGVELAQFEIDNRTAKLDLSLCLRPDGDGLSGWVEYRPELFDAGRIERLAQHWLTLLTGAVAAPDERIALLPLITAQEQQQLLVDWNHTEREYPQNKSIPELFRAQAQRTPGADAVIWGEMRWSYRHLQRRSEQFAAQLRQLGTERGSLVGVCLERSPELVAALLGTMMAGAAYVPLDPAYPAERLSYILQDAAVGILITERKLAGLLPSNGVRLLLVEELPEPNVAEESKLSTEAEATPAAHDLAYVIYTSGSTGRPKGVALEHQGAVALLSWARDTFSADELAGVLASTSVCFDLSVFELFVPLSWGGKVILAENVLALTSLPAARELTLINTVPSAIRECLRLKCVPASVQVVNLAGEPLASGLVDQIYRQTSVKKVYDLYGPTETTTYSTFALRQPGTTATIGRPLANEQIYLLDEAKQPVPMGIPGEVFIGGVGLARGYLNRPELTAEKFVAHPWQAGRRLYRTGDLARWRADGNLEYLGRKDYQVKVRGFRIELGEIEAVLKAHPQVGEAVVLAREDQPGDKRLVAYLVCPQGNPSVEELRQTVRARLPEYMLPAAFVFLTALPLTPNGKVDRKALPAPEPQVRPDNNTTAPRSKLEEQVLAIWREVLGHAQLGVRDNFFEFGGHSLLAARVISRLREQFQAEIPLVAFFASPTVEALAAGLAEGRWAGAAASNALCTVPRVEQNPLSFVQERLWFLDQLQPGSHAYHVVQGLRLEGPLQVQALQRALDALVARHEELRATFHYLDGKLLQVIAPSLSVPMARRDFQSVSPQEREAAARDWLRELAQAAFDLAQGPLWRVGLATLGAGEHLLVVAFHHLISDGWSLAVFFQELQSLYAGMAEGEPASALPELPIQYIDYVHWQRRCLQGPSLQKELNYWTRRLAGAPPTVALPADLQPAERPTGKAGRLSRLVPEQVMRNMAQLGQREGCTQFMVFMAALAITLQKWTQQKDLVIGTVVAGRTRRELEQVLGCFMNFLPIRTQLREQESGRQILGQVRRTVLEAQAHQECPFEKIVEAANPERRFDQTPLYNVALLLQNFPNNLFQTRQVRSQLLPVPMEAALLDLRFEAEITPQGMALGCEYRTDLFTDNTIELLLTSYLEVLDKLTTNPDTKIRDFKLQTALTEKRTGSQSRVEPQTLAVAGTFTAEPLAEALNYWLKELELPGAVIFAPYNQVFQQLLDPESLLSTNPRGLNVILLRLQDWHQAGHGAAGAEALTPAENLQRNRTEFAAALKAAASRSLAPYLVCFCPPSEALTQQPELVHLLEEAEAGLAAELIGQAGIYVLRTQELQEWYPVTNYADSRTEELGHVPYTPVFFTALATAVARKFDALNRPAYKVVVLDCDNTLWSGVCGEDGPSGIRLEPGREYLQRFLLAQRDAGKLLCLCSKNNEEDVQEVFARRLDMPLRLEHLSAWRLNWLPKSENLKALAAELNLGLESFILLDDNPVECAEVRANCPQALVLQVPEKPEQLGVFLKHCWVFDQLAVTAEDRRRAELYRQEQQREKLRNAAPSLADFVAGLDLRLAIEPATAEQVSRLSQLTQRTNQFNANPRRLADNEVQQLVLGAELLSVQVSDRFGDYGLVGVLQCAAHGQALAVELFLLSCRVLGRGVEHRMLARLGELAQKQGLEWVSVHFVPTAKNKPVLTFLENVGGAFKQPLNGGFIFRFPSAYAAKVTFNPRSSAPASPAAGAPRLANSTSISARKLSQYFSIAQEANEALAIHARVEGNKPFRTRQERSYTAPDSELERRLCQLWQELLHVERVGVKDDFFELGGHSLLAVRLFAEIEKVTGRKLPLVTVFQAPTVQALAALLSQQQAAPSRSLLVAVQPNGSKPPLFLVHGAGGDVLWGYANLAAHLPADQPVYGIKSRGQVGLKEPDQIEEMARYYLEAVRAHQPQGPYFLGGYCFGGNVAYEMARQLQAEGQRVALLALLDSAPANAGYETMSWWRPGFAWRFACNACDWLRDFAALAPVERRRFLGRKLRALMRKIQHHFKRSTAAPFVDLEEMIDTSHFPEHELKLWQAHLEAMSKHVEQPYIGKVTLLRTKGQPLFCSLEEDFCWGRLALGGVLVRRIPGSHENIFVEPNVRFLAQELAAALELAQRQPLRSASPNAERVTTALVA